MHGTCPAASRADHPRHQENALWQRIFLTHNVVGVYAHRLKNVMNVLRSCCAITACVSTRNKTTDHPTETMIHIPCKDTGVAKATERPQTPLSGAFGPGIGFFREVVCYDWSSLYFPWSSITRLADYLCLFFTQKRAQTCRRGCTDGLEADFVIQDRIGL